MIPFTAHGGTHPRPFNNLNLTDTRFTSLGSNTPRINYPLSPNTRNLVEDSMFRVPLSPKQIDATNKIQAILDKSFDKLPVSKDIPRLLKKFFLISQFLSDNNDNNNDNNDDGIHTGSSNNSNDNSSTNNVDDHSNENIHAMNEENHHQHNNHNNIDTLSPPTLFSKAPPLEMSLVKQQQDDRWKHFTSIEFNRENYPDLVGSEDIPKEIIFYQMIVSIVNHVLLISKDRSSTDDVNSMFTIPSYQDYISHVDFNDHRTLNEFLLNAITFNLKQSPKEVVNPEKEEEQQPIIETSLENKTEEQQQPTPIVVTGPEENRNHLILLLKCCQQTIIINVLMGLREFTMKHKIHFKDARGAWRIYIGSEDNTLKESTNSQQSVFSSAFYVAHERSEQLYMKRLDWIQQYGISDEELAQLEASDPREQVNFSKGAMKQLFQFKWQIKLCFSNETISKLSNSDINSVDWDEFKLTHVDITLLSIDYVNEDLTVSHPQYCTKEANLLEQYFGMFRASATSLSPSLTSPNQGNDAMSPTTLEFSKITLGSPFNTPRSVGTPTVMSSSFLNIIGSSSNGKSSPLTKHVTTHEDLSVKTNDKPHVVETREPVTTEKVETESVTTEKVEIESKTPEKVETEPITSNVIEKTTATTSATIESTITAEIKVETSSGGNGGDDNGDVSKGGDNNDNGGDNENKNIIEQVVVEIDQTNVIVEKEQEKEVSENSLLINNVSNNGSRTTPRKKNQQVPPQQSSSNSNSNIQYQQDSTPSNLIHSDKVVHTAGNSKIDQDSFVFCIPRTLLIAIPLLGRFFVIDHHHSDKQHEKEHDEDGESSEERKLLD